ncbi:MAG: hypothetical protein J7L11_06715 [Thermoprotei archaeon]|nr:hypothetical protein [Thermoprotei archaeon]
MKVTKRFIARRSQTLYELTDKGRKAYVGYVSTLLKILRADRKPYEWHIFNNGP